MPPRPPGRPCGWRPGGTGGRPWSQYRGGSAAEVEIMGTGPETDLMPTYPSQLSGGNPKCVWPLSLIAHALMASPTRIDSPGPPGHAVGGGRGGGVGMGAP